jgi:hypothetical protein
MDDDSRDVDDRRQTLGARADEDRENSGNYPWRPGERERMLDSMLEREREEREAEARRIESWRRIREAALGNVLSGALKAAGLALAAWAVKWLTDHHLW